MPAGHAESGPGSVAEERGLGTSFSSYGLRQAHFILHGWSRRISRQVLLCLEKKNSQPENT